MADEDRKISADEKRLIESLEKLDGELVDYSADQLRDLIDSDELGENLRQTLDEAQGPVFSGTQTESFVLIRITR